MTELETRITDCWIIDNRQETGGVRHERAVEKRLVVVEEVDEIDVAVHVRSLVAELQKHALELQILGFGLIGNEADEAKGLALVFGEGGGFVQGGVVQQIGAALGVYGCVHRIWVCWRIQLAAT